LVGTAGERRGWGASTQIALPISTAVLCVPLGRRWIVDIGKIIEVIDVPEPVREPVEKPAPEKEKELAPA
jgi:hypothetical protein